MKISSLLLCFFFISSASLAVTKEKPKQSLDAKPMITLELNKLKQSKENCFAYFIIQNKTPNYFTTFKTEFIVFDKNDIIINNIALVDFKKIRPNKTVVKYLGLPKTQCSKISKILINGVSQCKVETQEKEDCLDLVTPSHKSTTTLFK